MSNVTDMLIESGRCAVAGDVYINDIRERHSTVIDALGVDPSIIEPELDELTKELEKISGAKDFSSQMYAKIVSFGELFSSKIIAAYAVNTGLNATAFGSFELGLLTDSDYKEADVLQESYASISKNIAAISPGVIPIVTSMFSL